MKKKYEHLIGCYIQKKKKNNNIKNTKAWMKLYEWCIFESSCFAIFKAMIMYDVYLKKLEITKRYECIVMRDLGNKINALEQQYAGCVL